ncbi:hypothetical protein HaLaN_14437 [Haematococcus lacustris]|uniref:Uncharacterized protein n=1 Tax=Haematococcus lacustris TaxID=44745 RepID=A0A699ZPC9_HAELA|nr:hypothetical protein HaLaN_14437 [Haematococcus lacustris]
MCKWASMDKAGHRVPQLLHPPAALGRIAVYCPVSLVARIANFCRTHVVGVSCKGAAIPAPGLARATSRLNSQPTAGFGMRYSRELVAAQCTRYMPTFAHPNNGQQCVLAQLLSIGLVPYDNAGQGRCGLESLWHGLELPGTTIQGASFTRDLMVHGVFTLVDLAEQRQNQRALRVLQSIEQNLLPIETTTSDVNASLPTCITARHLSLSTLSCTAPCSTLGCAKNSIAVDNIPGWWLIATAALRQCTRSCPAMRNTHALP